MELLQTPRITLKSTLSLEILFSASPDAVKLLQQTPSSRTLLLLTEFRQPLQVQSHLEMPGILVQLGHTQRT